MLKPEELLGVTLTRQEWAILSAAIWEGIESAARHRGEIPDNVNLFWIASAADVLRKVVVAIDDDVLQEVYDPRVRPLLVPKKKHN
jgi:hypothetical protein